MSTYKSLPSLLISVGLILISLFLTSCANVEDLEYNTNADHQMLLELEGKTVVLLPMQYNDKAIMGVETLDDSLAKVVMDHQKSVFLAEFGEHFNMVDVSEVDALLGEAEVDVSNSELMRELIRQLNVDAAFIVINSYGYEMDDEKTTVMSYAFASNTYLVDKEGKTVWNFYGKAHALPKPSELFNLKEFIRGIFGIFGVRPSEQRLGQAMAFIVEHYTAYLHWLMEADIEGTSTKNYFAHYPEEKRDKYITVFPASDISHVPGISDAPAK